MVAKAVIDIDVNDAKFQNFLKAFEKFQNAVKKLPADWQNVGKESSKATQANNKELDKSVTAQKKISDEVGRADKNQKSFNKSVRDGGRELASAARTAAGIATSMASAAMSVTKWVAFGAIGGGFGLGGLASSASDYRRQAQGYGVTTGQLRAANTNFGRYVNPEGALGNIADLQNDLSRRWMLTNLGVGVGQNPAEALPTAMRNATRMFKSNPNEQYAKAMGLLDVFTMQDLRRMASLSEAELDKTIAKYKEDQAKMAVSDEDSRAWQDFWVKLRDSGQMLETSFLKSLVRLAPELEKLSGTITNLILSGLNSEKARKGIEDFADYLGSDKFQKHLDMLIEALGKIASAAYGAAKFLGLVSEPKKTVTEKAVEKEADIAKLPRGQQAVARAWASGGHNTRAYGTVGLGKEDFALMGQLEAKYGLPAGTLSTILKKEGSSPNEVSKAGAIGRFQMMPGTASDYGVQDPTKFAEAAPGAAKMMQHLLTKYNGDMNKALAAYNWGEGNLDHYLRGDKGYTNSRGRYVDTHQLPSETVNYIGGARILVQNDTGGSAVVSTSALPGAGPTR